MGAGDVCGRVTRHPSLRGGRNFHTIAHPVRGLEHDFVSCTHAVHLHENGDCSAEDGSSAGGHWNPTMKPHGKRGDGTSFHKGDIGNMTVGNDGKGTMSMTVDGWSIGGADSTNGAK